MKVDVSEIKSAKDFERFLRDVGFARSFARAVTSQGFKVAAAAGLRDADAAENSAIADAIKSLSRAIIVGATKDEVK